MAGVAIRGRLRRFYRVQSRKERLYSVVNLVLSVMSVMFYVRDTSGSLNERQRIVDMTLSVYFVCIFIYEFWTAHDKAYHVRRWMTWADFLSLLPVLRVALSRRTFRAFRAFRILRIHRILSFYPPGSKRRIVESCVVISSVLFLLTALVFEVAHSHSSMNFSEDEITFLDSFYYVVVTFSTVGYGDISPAAEISRTLISLAIPPMIIIVPVVLTRVFNELSSWPRYAHAMNLSAGRGFFSSLERPVLHLALNQGRPAGIYHENYFARRQSAEAAEDDRRMASRRQREIEADTFEDWHHVVISGNLVGDSESSMGRALPVFLEHCFLSDRASRYLQLVILNAKDPTKLVEKCILDHPYYQSRVAWVTGSAYEPHHVLDWARARTASAIVVVGNVASPLRDHDNEDLRTVRQTVAIRHLLETRVNDVQQQPLRPWGSSASLEMDESFDDDAYPAVANENPRIVAFLMLERNRYLLAEEERNGVTVLTYDRLKNAMLARSTRVPMIHSLVTSLALKRPHRRLVVDDEKLTAFDRGGSTAGDTIFEPMARKSFSRQPSISNLTHSELSPSHRRSLMKTIFPPESPDVDFATTSPRRVLTPKVSTESGEPPQKGSSSRFSGIVNTIRNWRGAAAPATSDSSSSSSESDDDHTLDTEKIEKDLSASQSLHEIQTTPAMAGVPFGVLAVAAHDALKHLARRLAASKRRSSILGALPVAVVLGREVLNFPAAYRLRTGDSLLVVARSRRDALAILDSLDYDSLREPASDDDVKEDEPEEFDREATVAMEESFEIGRRPAQDRARYMAEWTRTHVVAEVPADLSGHVVFCGPVDQVPYFLQPLLVRTDPAPASPRPPPDVVVLDHANLAEVESFCDPDDGVPKVSHAYTRLLEDIVFYDPLIEQPTTTRRQRRSSMNDAAVTNSSVSFEDEEQKDEGGDVTAPKKSVSWPQLPPTPEDVRKQRLWVVIGDPTERSRAHRASGSPSALERAGVERCSHFILPRAKDVKVDEFDDVFLDDDYNCRVSRNVDSLTMADHRSRLAMAPVEAMNVRHIRRRLREQGVLVRPPKVLIELDDASKVKPLLTVRGSSSFSSSRSRRPSQKYYPAPDDLVVGAYGEAASRDAKCEVFSTRLLHALPIVAAVDSEAIVHFINHAVCAWTQSGERPKLNVGSESYESCCIVAIPVPETYVDRDFASFLRDCVSRAGALPIALYRRSSSHRKRTVFDAIQQQQPPQDSVGPESFSATRRASKLYGRFATNMVETRNDGDSEDHDEGHYIYVNPLPGDRIRKHDRAYVLANSKTHLNYFSSRERSRP